MTQPRQLALDLGHRVAFSAADFLVAPSNAQAMAWLERWPDWPAPALALYGPQGSGKTHLAHIFSARAQAPILAAAALTVADPPRLLDGRKAAVIEDGDRGVDEVALFHLYNMAKESGASLLLTGRQPPARWPLALADLRSRLNAIPAVPILAPDENLMGAVLLKLFADRQVIVGHEVVAWLAARLERSFAVAGDLVARLDRAALAEKRDITIPFARAVLEEMEREQG